MVTEPGSCFVDDDHPYVKEILGMRAQGLDDGGFRPFRGVIVVVASREEDM